MTDNISLHIATLLRRNDCVIIPGVGAFVATRRQAELSGDLMLPPRREISFNPAMVHDDGLLASSVSRRLKISFEQARERVAAESALIQRRLRNEGAVNLPRIGILRRRSGGRLEFLPVAAWALVPPPVRMLPAAPTFEVVRPAAETPEKAVAVVRVPLRLRWLRIAAAAVILSVLGFALSTPIDISTAQHATLAAPSFTPPEVEAIAPLAEPAGLELNLAMAPASGAISTAKPEVAAPAPKPYVIVVASLPTEAKAAEFIANAGVDLKVLNSGGRFRVYAAEGSSPEEARAAAEQISGFAARFPDSWVCRR
ncbi:MAG: SPOR domain-containing protein [Muribaculaceae bacterium]|nr:SPOR domain-containing protein [Muribaculaceae bacterium]